ncbi:hypothetical protein ES703_86390 [subsurface metagenome]
MFILFYRINKENTSIALSENIESPWILTKTHLFLPSFEWEQERTGISTPPINIIIDNNNEKFLLFYHGVEEKNVGTKTIKCYHLGAFFLSTNLEKGKLKLKIERLKKPVLSPSKDYEINNRWLSSVGVHAVFSCGAIPVKVREYAEIEDEVYIYYGAGDSVINLAKTRIFELLQEEMEIEYKEIKIIKKNI